jgi:hypothetical protein
MRFNTPEEVVKWADKAAAEDYERVAKWGGDLNPYCTYVARHDWQNGYDNKTPRYGAPIEYDLMHQRGRAMARLIASKPMPTLEGVE